jgi:hypothetical protein
MRRKEIDPNTVRQLAMIGCTIAAIAEHFNCCREPVRDLEAGCVGRD